MRIKPLLCYWFGSLFPLMALKIYGSAKDEGKIPAHAGVAYTDGSKLGLGMQVTRRQ